MRWIYNFLFFIILPFIFLRLLKKSRYHPSYLQRWSERIGLVPTAIPAGVVWWHCASVGETLAAIPLIQTFQKIHPALPVLVTTITPTGSFQVEQKLGHTVFHLYMPYDFCFFIKRFIKQLQPSIFIIVETELWPNALYYCHQYAVPVLLTNARLSEKSLRGYQKLSSFSRQMLSYVTLIAAQTHQDRARFLKLGYPEEKIFTTGNVKFDLDIPQDFISNAKKLRQQWQLNKPVWIAASTHMGEEEIILNAAKQVPGALLILAPRHPERRQAIKLLCRQAGLIIKSYSQKEWPDNNCDVFLIDTLGELLLFYALSDIAFVGGSLVPAGGHNLLEPAALGLPIISGKSLFNFAEAEQLLSTATALIKINNATALVKAIKKLLIHPEEGVLMGKAAQSVIINNKGASEKQLAFLTQLLQNKPVN